MDLCSPKTVRELLERHGLSPKKGYGQNFLINRDVPHRIAASAALGCDAGYDNDGFAEGVMALEIGPGIGSMTVELSEMFEKVVAVEIDRGLIPLLEETLEECSNVTVINDDFLKLDLSALIDNQAGNMPVAVCANLPYYVTTPVLMKILEEYPLCGASRIQSVTVMVQTEVADRICATPENAADYGALSVSVALHGKAKKLFNVSPGNFYPAPKVSSSVVQISLRENGIYDVYDKAPTDKDRCLEFSENVKNLVNLAFLKRRKTLVNALSGEFPKEKTESALDALGIRRDIRGEKLSALDFCRLADILYN